MRNIRPKPPTITLSHLLKRRGHTFDTWMSSAGISSYPEVLRWCSKIGVLPPSEDEYKNLRPLPQTAPADGIVVLEVAPLSEVDETMMVSMVDEAPEVLEVLANGVAKKKSRRKSETAGS
jgi:hypothetical protein